MNYDSLRKRAEMGMRKEAAKSRVPFGGSVGRPNAVDIAHRHDKKGDDLIQAYTVELAIADKVRIGSGNYTNSLERGPDRLSFVFNQLMEDRNLKEIEQKRILAAIDRRMERALSKAVSKGAYDLTLNYLPTAEKIRGELEKLRSSSEISGIERATATTTVLTLAGGLFLLSPNFTGNAILNVTNSTGNLLGITFVVIGLIAGFFLIKK